MLNIFQMKNLMLEALATEDSTLMLGGENFKMYGYVGNTYILFSLTERVAIKKGLVADKVKLPSIAWGATGSNLFEGQNTNFKAEEVELMYEAFHLLLQQNIIAPGGYRESYYLPTFHVTAHGHECLKQLEFLPYDFNGFLSSINSIEYLDNWVKYYLIEALKCFNANCYQASIIMIGLASEKLTLDLLDSFGDYLQKNESNIAANDNFTIKSDYAKKFNKEIDDNWQISTKYSVFEKYVRGLKIDKSIKSYLDNAARNTFYQFIRLNRNEVSHPCDLTKDETETMLIFISFIKYVSIQTKLIHTLKQ